MIVSIEDIVTSIKASQKVLDTGTDEEVVSSYIGLRDVVLYYKKFNMEEIIDYNIDIDKLIVDIGNIINIYKKPDVVAISRPKTRAEGHIDVF